MIKYILKKQLDAAISKSDEFNIFTYIKRNFYNLIFDSLDMDYATSKKVKKYLYNNCRLPTIFVSKYIVTAFKNVDNGSKLTPVPYLINNSHEYFLYKGCILRNENVYRENRPTLKFLRGTLDIKSLIFDSFNYDNNIEDTSDEPYFNNFYIKAHYGTDNSMLNVSIGKDNEIKPTSAKSLDESGGDEYTIYHNDVSLLYEKSRIFEYKVERDDPFKTYYFPEKLTNYVSSISQWLKNDTWFYERHLPYKRGILLHGPAGTGKSSFAKALGMKFGIPIHQFHLSNMSDNDFKESWEKAVQNSRVIILIEDFDNVYNKRTPINAKTKLNFDTILNTISGIQDMSGVILIITTNDISKIDEAIGVSTKDSISTRPGRIDDVIYLGKMENTEKHKLATKILKDWPLLIEDVMANTTDYTVAQVQEYSIKLALNELKKSNTII